MAIIMNSWHLSAFVRSNIRPQWCLIIISIWISAIGLERFLPCNEADVSPKPDKLRSSPYHFPWSTSWENSAPDRTAEDLEYAGIQCPLCQCQESQDMKIMKCPYWAPIHPKRGLHWNRRVRILLRHRMWQLLSGLHEVNTDFSSSNLKSLTGGNKVFMWRFISRPSRFGLQVYEHCEAPENEAHRNS